MEGLKEILRERFIQAGAVAVGFAKAEPVAEPAIASFQHWLQEGKHGALSYMENYPILRFNPTELLPGAHTIVSIAWPYLPPIMRKDSLPFIARYAYAPDYHKSIRRIIKPIIKEIDKYQDAKWRICVDSAPVMERYWAVRSGVGFTGRNGCLIVPGYGSWVFLSELLTTLSLEADTPCIDNCRGCGACIKSCPTGALKVGNSPDCRLCLSALTIEQPGHAPQLPPDQRTLAGCDRCQEVCPHNRSAKPHQIEAFMPSPQLLELSPAQIQEMSQDEFHTKFSGSALSRIGPEGLRANLNAMR